MGTQTEWPKIARVKEISLKVFYRDRSFNEVFHKGLIENR